MTKLEKLRESVAMTSSIAEEIMRNPASSEDEFSEAFAARDRAYVESLGMTDEQIGEARWETMAGCNGTDSPFHSYFGFASDSD